MTRTAVQFVLTIDGCCYAAATPSCSTSATSSDGDWPAGVIVVPGGLAAKALNSLSWDEETKPITGETTASGISLTLDDVKASSGPASGENVWSWSFSRRPRNVTKTQLSASITDSSASIVVTGGSAFPAGDQIIWIDREAIHCSGRVGNTFTVAASGRGYLGTRAAAHTIDTENAFRPVVWAEFPNPQRRRAILWMVQGTTATPLWRGYLGRAPRLDQKGAQWEVQLDHALTVQTKRALGPSQSTVRIAGFDPSTFNVSFMQLGGAGAAIRTFSVLREQWTTAIPATIEQCCNVLFTRLRAQLDSADAGGISVTFSLAPSEKRPRITVTNSDVRHSVFFTRVALPPGSCVPTENAPDAAEPWQSIESAPGTFTSQRTLNYTPTAHILARNGQVSTISVDRTGGLPSSGLTTAYTDGAVTTTVQWALTGTDKAGLAFHIGLLTVTPATTSLTGVMRRTPVGISERAIQATGDILFSEPTPVSLCTVVRSGHWVRALQRGVFASGYGIDEQADPRDWDWSRANDVISATGGEYSTARLWVFDGESSVGDFLKDVLRLDVCTVAFKGSRLAVVPMGPPLPTDTASLTIDLPSGDGIHQQPPWFSTLPDGIVNVVRLKQDGGPSITVNNQGSIAQFGLAPALELEAKGAIVSVAEGQTPFDLMRGPFSRLLGMWALPSDMIRVSVPIDQITTTERGAVVDVRSKTLPDGVGRRGVITTRRGRIHRRAVDFQSGMITIDVLLYGSDRIAGYAPVIRVSAFSGTSNLTVTAAVNYLTSSATATDYAGSNSANYSGTLNDGGVSKFKVGDFVKFRVVDSTTLTEESGFQVTSVIPGSAQVTITPNPASGTTNWVATLGGGATVELIADDYANATAWQRGYAYMGDKSTGEISTGVPNQEWAP